MGSAQYGFIQDFYGNVNTIPRGWFLCDGTNGTPDLRGMFIVGYDPRDSEYNQVGKNGGLKSVTLTEGQMPSHSHTGSTSMSGSHSHFVAVGEYYNDNNSTGVSSTNSLRTRGDSQGDGHRYQLHGVNKESNSGKSSISGEHSHTIVTNTTGGGQAHENRPPFYTMIKIMFKGE